MNNITIKENKVLIPIHNSIKHNPRRCSIEDLEFPTSTQMDKIWMLFLEETQA